MVDFKRLADRAKGLVEQRGGTEGLKQDATELMGIAKSKGSVKDKAKAAAEALKQPKEGEAAKAEPQGRKKSEAAPTEPAGQSHQEPAASPQPPSGGSGSPDDRGADKARGGGTKAPGAPSEADK